MDKIEDTYFLDAISALEVAKEANRFGAYNYLQICYYSGDKIESAYQNHIHLPKEKMVERLLELNTRVPTKFLGVDENFCLQQLQGLAEKKEQFSCKYIKTIQGHKLDFQEKLRVYIGADYGGKVVLKIYEQLSRSFLKASCEVWYDVNDALTIMDDYRRVKNIAEFKPHITVNINRVRNESLGDEIFNFIWFQDPTLILYDESTISKRQRDYFYYLVENFKEALLAKGIANERISKQSFATNRDVFYEERGIKRENKVVFIGNNYLEIVSPTLNYKDETLLLDKLNQMFNQKQLSKEKIKELSFEYVQKGLLKSEEHLEMFLFPAIVRIEILKWICKQTIIEVEIYGTGWSDIEELQPYYKGYLEDETTIRRICNSAKYSLLAHPEYYYQQRLMEASACGSIPLVYKGTNNFEEFYHQDNVLFFDDEESLLHQIGKIPLQPQQKIADDMSYEKFIAKMIKIVKENQ